MLDAATLREQLKDVYWIGGGSGAGKSTIAQRVALRHSLSVLLTPEIVVVEHRFMRVRR